MLNEQQKAVIEKLSKVDNISTQLTTLSQEAQKRLNELTQYEAEANKHLEEKEGQLHKKAEDIDRIAAEKTQGFPWLADAFAQYFYLQDIRQAQYLENKSHPAIAEARRIREVAAEKREFQKEFRIARNLVRYYEALFPWLRDLVGEDIDELLVQAKQEKEEAEDIDPARPFLADGEWSKLSPTERNQLALDRYWKSRRTSWQIGRDYERYIGYLYEQEGFSVYYHGIEHGLVDLGRDLICKKGEQVEIIQCKYWRQERTVHHRHVSYLFGTTVEYFIHSNEHLGIIQMDLFPQLLRSNSVTPTIFTSTSLSEAAKKCARILGVKVRDQFPFNRYPSIKCNVSRKDGSQIYHLPFDQQYDRTLIEQERNECYVETVAEAERLGFRRAWRWKGKS